MHSTYNYSGFVDLYRTLSPARNTAEPAAATHRTRSPLTRGPDTGATQQGTAPGRTEPG